MGYYGYRPQRKDYSAIRDIGNIVGGAVQQIGGVVEAAKAAKENWSAMEDAYKSIKSAYQKQATPMVESGVLTQEDLENNLGMLPPPTTIHKKNPEGYLTTLRSGWRNISDNLAKKQQAMQQVQRSQAIGGAVSEQMAGRPATTEMQPTGPEQDVGGFTEQDITQVRRPEISPAETKEQAYGAVSQRQYPGGPITTKEFEQYGGKYLPSGLELRKQQADEEHKKKMRARGYSKDAQDKEMKKLDMLRKMRNDESRKSNQLDSQKRSLMNIRRQLEKGEMLDMGSLQALENEGINGQELQDMATTNPEELKVILDDLMKDIDTKIKMQRKNSQEVENAYMQLQESPGTDIFKLLKTGRQTAEGQEALDVIQGATGGQQGITQWSPTMGLPERGTSGPQLAPLPQDVEKTLINQGVWDTIQEKVSAGRLSPVEAEQYFREYISRK